MPFVGLSSGEETGTISVKKQSGAAGQRAGADVFSMEFRDADLKDVLRAIGQEHQLNIIMSENISGKLTLSFRDVTLHEALEAILKINNLMSVRDDNILRVVKSPFQEGEGDLMTRILPVRYANVKETSATVKELLSTQGKVVVDVRTNSIVIRDVPANLDRIAKVVRDLDSRTPQILIEARIVEANTNFTRQLGIQWGGNFTQFGGNGTFQATGGVTQTTASGAANPLTGGVGLSGNNFLVNLPATVASGSGGAVALSFGNLANTRQLDLQLSAMEDTGQGKILSNPRILTLNNMEAKISSGTEILIPNTTSTGTGTTTGTTGTTGTTTGATTTGVTKIDAKLELTVTPHISADNQIVLHVKTDKKEPDYNRQVQGIPPLSTRTAETDLLVKDGETIVIGGIYTRNESFQKSGIPWLSSIPVLGWLFKKEVTVDSQNELLIFITPYVQGG
jgi:type IV pilus assembly protein PilQ